MKTSGQKAVETHGIRVADNTTCFSRAPCSVILRVCAHARASRLRAKIYLGAALLRLGVSGRLIFQGLSKRIGEGGGEG